MYRPWKVLFERTIFIEKAPMISFIIVMAYTFLFTRYIINIAD